jgi:hypothetical protein
MCTLSFDNHRTLIVFAEIFTIVLYPLHPCACAAQRRYFSTTFYLPSFRKRLCLQRNFILVSLLPCLKTHGDLASLLRHGTPIPIHGSQGKLLTVTASKYSQLADRAIADVFEQFPELLVVAIIRDQHVQLPRGSTRLAGGDQLLIVASETPAWTLFRDWQTAAAVDAPRVV